MPTPSRLPVAFAIAVAIGAGIPAASLAQRTQKPPRHGREGMAVTGKPLGAAAGAKVYLKGEDYGIGW